MASLALATISASVVVLLLAGNHMAIMHQKSQVEARLSQTVRDGRATEQRLEEASASRKELQENVQALVERLNSLGAQVEGLTDRFQEFAENSAKSSAGRLPHNVPAKKKEKTLLDVWGDTWAATINDERCAGAASLGHIIPKVPPFGYDWPSKSVYDNQRKRCAFKGTAPYKALRSTLLDKCEQKRQEKGIQHFSKPKWPSCPPLLTTALFQKREKAFVHPDGKGHGKNKYSNTYSKQCPTSRGMWGGSYIPSMECVVQYAARDMQPGDLILDWGSGCGHQGAWLEAYFGVHVFGVDIAQAAVDWANKNTFGKYCTADGSDLSFVEDRSFDGVFSYATLYHLPHTEQCVALKECIRVTKDGGKIFIGWNGNHIADRPSPHPTDAVMQNSLNGSLEAKPGKNFWEDCLAESPRAGRIQTTLEREDVIGKWGLGNMDENSFGRHVPNYAIEIWVTAG